MSETFVLRTNNAPMLVAALIVASLAPYVLLMERIGGVDVTWALAFLCIIGVYAVCLATGTICYKD